MRFIVQGSCDTGSRVIQGNSPRETQAGSWLGRCRAETQVPFPQT